MVDQYLSGDKVAPEVRQWSSSGKIEIIQKPTEEGFDKLIEKEEFGEVIDKVNIFPFAVNRDKLERAIKSLDVPAQITNNLDDADIVITTRAQNVSNTKLNRMLIGKRVSLHIIKRNTAAQALKFLRNIFKIYSDDEERKEEALREIELIIEKVKNEKKAVEANPQNAYIRRLQHQFVNDKGLHAESIGEEPQRRLKIYSK